jgi:hypothetical protein
MRRSRDSGDETGPASRKNPLRITVTGARKHACIRTLDGLCGYNAGLIDTKRFSSMALKHTHYPARFAHLVAALAALATAASAQAQVGAAVTADLGTTGAGVHLVVPMERNLNGRFGANYFKHDFEKRSGLVDYKMDGKLATFDVLFDWYVIPQSSFRLTGGLVYNGTRFKAVGVPAASSSFTFNGNTYSTTDIGRLEGDVTFRRAAPYIGIGWGNALTPNKRWNFAADIGAFHQGKAKVNLIPYGCTTSNTVCRQLASDVAVEEVRLQEEASDFKVYPVLRASISYSF